jgi:hypothetical protein
MSLHFETEGSTGQREGDREKIDEFVFLFVDAFFPVNSMQLLMLSRFPAGFAETLGRWSRLRTRGK